MAKPIETEKRRKIDETFPSEHISHFGQELAAQFDRFALPCWNAAISGWEKVFDIETLQALVRQNEQRIQSGVGIHEYLEDDTTEELEEYVKTLRPRGMFILSCIVFFQGEEKLPQKLLRFLSALGDWRDRFEQLDSCTEQQRQIIFEGVGKDLQAITEMSMSFKDFASELREQGVSREVFLQTLKARRQSIEAFLKDPKLKPDDMHTLRKQLRNFFHLSILLAEETKESLTPSFQSSILFIQTFLRSINSDLGALRETFLADELSTGEATQEYVIIPDKIRKKIAALLQSLAKVEG